MKLKEFFYLIGFRPKVKKYGYSIERTGEFEWANWQHPKSKDQKPRMDDLPKLKEFLSPGDFVIDIGAHIGDTAVPQALAVGKDGAVLALEPNPNVYEILEVNSRLNPETTHIIPLNAAVMPEEGTYTFHYNDPGLCNGGYQKGISLFKHCSFFAVEVRGINLENYLLEQFPDRLPKLRLIKTDTEGLDYKIFRQIRSLIEKYRPHLQAEVNRNMPQEERIAFLNELKELNYEVHMLEGESLDTMVPATVERFQDVSQTFDLFAFPRASMEAAAE